MKTYQVTLHGSSALLMHWDNIDFAATLRKWREDPRNKSKSVAGDDRSPAFTWIGSLYHDGEHVALPQENIMRVLMEGGAQVVVPGGKNGKTFKAQTQSGIMPEEPFWPLLVDGKPVPMKPVRDLLKVDDFDEQCEKVQPLGFYLYVKRAKIGASKHVRVRPRFDRWQTRGTLVVLDDAITLNVLRDILSIGGRYKGLGDWRPSSPKSPGPFGRFTAEVKQVS